MTASVKFARRPRTWLNLTMRFLPLLLFVGCSWDEPSTSCPTVACPFGEVCTMEGDCVRLANRDAGLPDAGIRPDAGPVCGNGVVEDGEECDDANAIETDACLNE